MRRSKFVSRSKAKAAKFGQPYHCGGQKRLFHANSQRLKARRVSKTTCNLDLYVKSEQDNIAFLHYYVVFSLALELRSYKHTQTAPRSSSVSLSSTVPPHTNLYRNTFLPRRLAGGFEASELRLGTGARNAIRSVIQSGTEAHDPIVLVQGIDQSVDRQIVLYL